MASANPARNTGWATPSGATSAADPARRRRGAQHRPFSHHLDFLLELARTGGAVHTAARRIWADNGQVPGRESSKEIRRKIQRQEYEYSLHAADQSVLRHIARREVEEAVEKRRRH